MSIIDKMRSRNPKNKRSAIYLSDPDSYDILCASGYTPLWKIPEFAAACDRIAELISSMTIYLMTNTSGGDRRIRNELSRKVDIEPMKNMTRRTWMQGIVSDMLIYGKGNAVVFPHTSDGYLEDLEPIAASRVSFECDANKTNYRILIDGISYDPSNLLHFVFKPDREYKFKGQGIQVSARSVADRLEQAGLTKTAFMQSKYRPSLIVKVDGLTEEFSSPEGRSRLLESYISTSKAGEPWMIPADACEVEQVKPLSLADLAINDAVEIDKKTVAAIMGVPPYVVGAGAYNADEWDAFIANTIRPIAQEIEQELTLKLLTSPKMYWMFNIAKLYSYNLKVTSDVYSALYDKGIVTGNEVREKMSLEPKEGLDELIVLENYLPIDQIGKQKKVSGNE